MINQRSSRKVARREKNPLYTLQKTHFARADRSDLTSVIR